MQHQTSREMTTNLDSGEARHDLLGGALDQAATAVRVLSAGPSLVFGGYVHGTVECLGPVEVGRVVVWVRDDDGFDPVEGRAFEGLDGLVVHVGEEIPHDRAVGRGDEDHPLTDAELGQRVHGVYIGNFRRGGGLNGR